MKEVEKSKEFFLRKGECIYIESCDEMYDVYYEFLVQIQEILNDYYYYEDEEWSIGDFWFLLVRGGQCGR